MIHPTPLSTIDIVLELSGVFPFVMYFSKKTSFCPQSHTCAKAFG